MKREPGCIKRDANMDHRGQLFIHTAGGDSPLDQKTLLPFDVCVGFVSLALRADEIKREQVARLA
jgi:hypothetical protein